MVTCKIIGFEIFIFISIIAITSPTTKVAVVLDVGARLRGHASFLIEIFIDMSEYLKIFESSFPQRLRILQPIFFKLGNRRTISGVQPEFDIMRTTSFFLTEPISPCKPSLG